MDTQGMSLPNVGGTPSIWSVMNALMAADKREIEKSILHPRKRSTVEQALEHLLEHVKVSSNNIVHICVPLLEHIVKSPESNTRRKALLILRWMFQEDEAWLPLVNALIHIISGSEFDRTLKLGACLVTKDVLLNNSILKTQPVAELTFRTFQSIPIFSACVPHLLDIARPTSVNDRGRRLATRLSISAADCVLVITSMLAKATPENMVKNASLPGGWDDILWSQPDNIISLLSELHEWYSCARPLYAKGLVHVQKQLREIQQSFEADRVVATSVLKTCWPEYVAFILSETETPSATSKKLQTILSALQQYAEDVDKRLMRRYMLTCLALLLGRLDVESLDTSLPSNIHELVLRQLFTNDDETVDLAVGILKFLFFQRSSTTELQSAFESLVIPLLNERDTTSKALVSLIAEYIAQHPSPDLQTIFNMLESAESAQRQNAVDIVTELMDSSSSLSLRHNLAVHLLNRLGDEELMNSSRASEYFARLDPAFVMPALVKRLYDSDEKVRSAASDSLACFLKRHAEEFKVVFILLDCCRNLSLVLQPPTDPGEIAVGHTKQPDVSRIMRLVPVWASKVTDWKTVVGRLLDKMFNDPSNPTLPRFMSELSDYLDNMYQVLFPRIRLEMIKYETEVGEQVEDSHELFGKLSPLLVLRVLSLNAYDHPDCKELYGTAEELGQGGSIAGLLVQWMCRGSVNDDVRKLSAELSGRLLPEALMPLVAAQLADATEGGSLLKVRSCIYAICTSLMLRGNPTLANPVMMDIRTLLKRILLWDTVSEDVQKAQHGCIDCFAVMIRAELDKPSEHRSIRQSQASSSHTLDRPHDDGILHGVLSCLRNDAHAISCGTSPSREAPATASLDEDSRTRFRVCMANVLISSATKIPEKSHHRFLREVFPVAFTLLQTEQESIIRVACIQILFSSVYHLQAPTISRYSNNLLETSLQALTRSTFTEEMLAGGKLLASLLINEAILEEIASSLVNIRQVLYTVSRMDTSPELHKLCDQLLCNFGV